MPLPAPYLVGFDGVRLDAETGEFPNYLFGRWSRQGTPLYYLVCFLFKTPLPFLIACLLAPFVRLRSRAAGGDLRRRSRWRSCWSPSRPSPAT